VAEILDNSELGYRAMAKFANGKLVEHNFTPEWFKAALEALKEQQRQQLKK
jgi:hypothetical protein